MGVRLQYTPLHPDICWVFPLFHRVAWRFLRARMHMGLGTGEGAVMMSVQFRSDMLPASANLVDSKLRSADVYDLVARREGHLVMAHRGRHLGER